MTSPLSSNNDYFVLCGHHRMRPFIRNEFEYVIKVCSYKDFILEGGPQPQKLFKTTKYDSLKILFTINLI